MEHYGEAEYLAECEDYNWEEDIEYDTEYINRQKLVDERKQREKDLVGRYLVVVTSRYQSGLNLFLQDDKYGDGHWTKFISNAKGFYDKSAAVVKAKNLRFNEPRVVLVQANRKLKEVYRNGGYKN